MPRPKIVKVGILVLSLAGLLSAASPADDGLHRDNPRSSVTAFLQACERQDYSTASEYLDLRNWSEANRKNAGPAIAKKLEAALTYAPQFSVMQLTQNPEGSAAGDPAQETVAIVTLGGQTYTVELERAALQAGQPLVWVFSPGTIAAVLNMNISSVTPSTMH